MQQSHLPIWFLNVNFSYNRKNIPLKFLANSKVTVHQQNPCPERIGSKYHLQQTGKGTWHVKGTPRMSFKWHSTRESSSTNPVDWLQKIWLEHAECGQTYGCGDFGQHMHTGDPRKHSWPKRKWRHPQPDLCRLACFCLDPLNWYYWPKILHLPPYIIYKTYSEYISTGFATPFSRYTKQKVRLPTCCFPFQ